MFPEAQPREWAAPANSSSEALGNNSGVNGVGLVADVGRRIGTAVNLRVQDYFQNGTQSFLRFWIKGGKEKEMPIHHKLEEILDAYLEVSRLGANPDGPLFPTTVGCVRPRTALSCFRSLLHAPDSCTCCTS